MTKYTGDSKEVKKAYGGTKISGGLTGQAGRPLLLAVLSASSWPWRYYCNMDAAQVRAKHQTLQPADRLRAPGLTRAAVEVLVAMVQSMDDENRLGTQQNLLSILMDDALWQSTLAIIHEMDLHEHDVGSLQQFREWHSSSLGVVASDGRISRVRNVWTKMQSRLRDGVRTGSSSNNSSSPRAALPAATTQRSGVDSSAASLFRSAGAAALDMSSRWRIGSGMRVLGSTFPSDLPAAPSYGGTIPHYSGRPTAYLGAMDRMTLPESPYEGSLAAWWDSKVAEHHATPMHVPLLELSTAPVVLEIAEVLRCSSGVAFADQEELSRLGRADATPRLYTCHMPVVTASHPRRWVLLRFDPATGLTRAYTYGVQLLASLMEVPPGDALRVGLAGVTESEALSMLGNGVNAADCARVAKLAISLLPGVDSGRTVVLADMACGCGAAIGCFVRELPGRCRIAFAADIARSCGLAFTTSFGGMLERFFPDAHSEESQQGMTSLGRVDILFAGFPCPPVSAANRLNTMNPHRRSSIEGLLSLVYAALAYVEKSLPRVVVLETADGLCLSADMRAVWRRLEATVRARSPGYEWGYVRTRAIHAGTLGTRNRLWLVGRCCSGESAQDSSEVPSHPSP